MSSPDRFLHALNGPDSHSAPKNGDVRQCRNAANGLAINAIELNSHQAEPVPNTDGSPVAPKAQKLDASEQTYFQFVAQERVASYAKFIESGPKQYIPAFKIFDPDEIRQSQSFPLNLCEFLAYKAALSYFSRDKIEKNLTQSHLKGISNFAFFADSSPYADTQGYGFVLNGIAYIVFRGTEFLTLADWATDFDTVLTDKLDDTRYESVRELVGSRTPAIPALRSVLAVCANKSKTGQEHS